MDPTLTTNITGDTVAEGLAGGFLGGFLGGSIAIIGIVGLVLLILLIIAWWKIFEKAGEAGWKSLIPIYNVYVYCRIIKINFWIFILLIPIIFGVISSLTQSNQTLNTIFLVAQLIYSIFLEIWISVRLAKSFKKGIGYILGLIFLPNIFTLILGFGSAKYDAKAIEK